MKVTVTQQAVAYQWSGTGYNATYTTSHKVVFNDNDGRVGGGRDGSEKVSIDDGAFGATSGSPYVIMVNFTDVAGDPHVEEFYFFNAPSDGGWYFVPGSGSQFSEGATLGRYQSHTVGWDYSDIACFCAGTRIATPRGLIKVDDLKAGDEILSQHGRVVVLRQILHRDVSEGELAEQAQLRPVCITAGALAPGLPEGDLRVSRQHRMLVCSPVARRMFGEDAVLVAAIRLTALPGIYLEPGLRPVRYFHLIFDQHEIVLAEGAPSESFYPGPQAMRGLPAPARAEFEMLFPNWSETDLPEPACFIPQGRKQKQLLARLAKNAKPVLAPSWHKKAALCRAAFPDQTGAKLRSPDRHICS